MALLGFSLAWSALGCDEAPLAPSPSDTSEAVVAWDAGGAQEGGIAAPVISEPDVAELVDSAAPSDVETRGPEEVSVEEADILEDVALGPAPGTLGAPCTTSDNCFSGWCMPSDEGMVCSKGCIESCPDGWSCQSIIGPSGAPAFVCVQPTALLCQPCVEHKECNQAIAAGTNLCVVRGDEGSYCGLACTDDAPCPEGYDCTAVPAPEGGTSDQCVPSEDALCECSGIGIELELQTGCMTTNALGSCAGARGCASEGLSLCDAPEASEEVCNGLDDDCDGEIDDGLGGAPCEVQNGSGTCPGSEVCLQGQMVCQGAPPIDEICNGVDDDCDGTLDEGFTDSEGDGIPDCSDPDDDNDGVEDDFDCEPFNAAVSPEVPESCNGIDDDCDGDVDEKNAEGCWTFWQDIDADGHGSMAASSRCLCGEDLATFYTVPDAEGEPSDCADLLPQIKPGAEELCDGVDDDCDGTLDEGFDDSDGDGTSDCTDLDTDGDGTSNVNDCAPNDPDIHLAAVEYCNGIDDNCNGITDDEDALGCTKYFVDIDSDGQGDAEVPARCLCAPDESTSYTALESGDCDDLFPSIYVGALELCNGIDDTCDGFTDEWFDDNDGDGAADCVDPDDDDDGVDDLSDCAPYDASVTPGALEVCNGQDDNCEGGADEPGSLGCSDYYLDVDGDGMGSDTYDPLCLCWEDVINHYTADEAGDCNDANPMIFEGATEVCNLLDDDCDGQTDEGVASPCGDCSSVCVLQLGVESYIPFDPANGLDTGVNVTDEGALTLQLVPGEGTYVHTVSGWEDAPTLWDRMWMEVEMPASGASIMVRYRTADSEIELGVSEWAGPFGPFTTGLLPVEINRIAPVLELELTLTSTDQNVNPILRDVSFITWKQE